MPENKKILSQSISTSIRNTIFYLPFKYSISITFLDIICNLLVLIPLGLYLPVLFNKQNILRDLILTTIFVLFLETTELLIRIGQFSFIDVLWNVISMLIGELIYYFLKEKLTNKVINYIQLYVVMIFLPIAIYAIGSVPLNWDIFAPIFDYKTYPYIW